MGQIWVTWASFGAFLLAVRLRLVCCDEKRIFTCDDSTVYNDIVDWDAGNKLQGLIIDCADNDLTVPEALAVVREKWGQPDIELRVDDVNTAGAAIRAALGMGSA
ncbi:hypothetical protein A5774_04490 [Corynebacterium sp. EPI-003-04-2554_SCH2473622]|uniref:hypothetical protein n=1 Tax=Corynebacterium pseudodiphtheriticum TaxID=37637 RepID=UPI0004792025|nr:hypothetical protein [Corynebacterium pseudodiphtheriticum]OBA54601.1 hypothetical protein A5774_04490 [Corynebacterium sp. EPI-003-04-2554_SCH2473622]